MDSKIPKDWLGSTALVLAGSATKIYSGKSSFMFSQLVPDVSKQNFYCKTMKGRKFEPRFISDQLSLSADTCYQLSVTAVIGEPFSHHGKIYCTELNYSSFIQLYTGNPFIHTLGEHRVPSTDAPPLCTLASCQLVSNANWI